MARWLLVGEGAAELGSTSHDGFLFVLLRQVAGHAGVALPDLTTVPSARLDRHARLPQPQPRGMAKVAARALRAAGALECEAVIVLVDNDHNPGRREELRDELRGSCDQLRHASGVAKETVEAWLLADGEAVPAPGGLPGRPEDLWGAPRDPASNHPKQVFVRLSRAARLSLDDVLRAWNAGRACQHAPWLSDFRDELLALIRECCPASEAPPGA